MGTSRSTGTSPKVEDDLWRYGVQTMREVNAKLAVDGVTLAWKR
jgi:hypothetical protein